MVKAHRYLGVDGCKSGWLVARLDVDPACSVTMSFSWHEQLGTIPVAAGDTRWFIDMPIGLLSDQAARPCDTALRRVLRRRSSTVFNPPVRPVLSTDTYEDANRISRQACGKGLSIQTWNIVPAVRAVDDLLADNPGIRHFVHEAHPEHLFALAAGEPLPSKHKEAGIEERRRILHSLWQSSPGVSEWIEIGNDLPGPSRVDDALDAAILSIACWHSREGRSTLPEKPMRDSRNLECSYSYPVSWREPR
jgi:predicted RNase H-like nuclease